MSLRGLSSCNIRIPICAVLNLCCFKSSRGATTTPWVKKQDTKLLAITSLTIIRFSKKFSLDDSVVNLQQSHIEIFHHALNISLHYTLWNMNVEKWHHSEIRISINDESQGSIAKNLRCDELLYYIFIIHSAGERILKIGEHLAKLRAKSLTVSYIPCALHFCPQKCRSRQISWKLVYYRQKLLFSVAMSTGRLMWVNYQEISNCCIPVLTYWLTDW